MTGNLARRVQQLEGAKTSGKSLFAFRSGPQDDVAVAQAEREAERTGRSLLVFQWLDVQT